jgi:hypothetical protein
MELTLQRRKSSAHCTVGELLADGVFQCFTLEDVVREVPGRPVVEWKVHGKTAIPSGRYRVELENSPRFGPDTLTIARVEGFSCIRVHAGNTDEDTDGCVLVGDQVEQERIVYGSSRSALADLRDLLVPRLKRGEEVWISIHNNEGV